MIDREAQGKIIELKMTQRCIEVDGAIVFSQGKNEPKGSFASPFAHLSIP